MKKILLLLLLLPTGAHAALDVERFDQAAESKHKVDLGLAYGASNFTLQNIYGTVRDTELKSSALHFDLDYGYGLSKEFALHFKWGYVSESQEERVNGNSASDRDIEISGEKDFALQLLGTHGDDVSVYHWGLKLSYGTGSNTSKQTASQHILYHLCL